MGNNPPTRERSRSHSAEVLSTKQLEQRHHAKSEEIPFDHYDSNSNQKVHNPYMSPISNQYTIPTPNRTKPSIRNSDNGTFFRGGFVQCLPSSSSPPPQSLKMTRSKSAKSPHKLTRSKSLKSVKSSKASKSQMRSMNLDESTKSMKSSKSIHESSRPKSAKSKSSKSSRSESPVAARSKSAHYFDSKSSRSTTINMKLKTVIIEGWLTKLGESSRKWKKRYWKLFDSGKLIYSEKPNGRFKKYAELQQDGVESMALKDETGFEMQIGEDSEQRRFLVFLAENKSKRDAWFAIIYHHFYVKGQQQVHQLMAKSNMQNGHYNNKQVHFAAREEYDQFDVNGMKVNNKRHAAKKESFDSIRAAMNGGKKENVFTILSPSKPINKENGNNGGVLHNGNGKKNGNGFNDSNHSMHHGQSVGNSSAKHNNGNTTNQHQKLKADHHVNSGKMNGGQKNQNNNNHSVHSAVNASAAPPPSQPKDGMIIFKEQYMKLECDGKTCLSLERVHYVLRKYEQWRGKSTKSLGMYRYINNGLGEYYNNTHLLNDFQHLVSVHDNVFHHIYEYLDGECPLGPDTTNCLLVQRLHRDRNIYRDDEERKIYYGYDDAKEMNTQQILDKIHCHFRHSYDLGLRVRASKLEEFARSHRRYQPSRFSRSMNARKVIKLRSEESKAAEAIIESAENNNEVVSDNEEPLNAFPHDQNDQNEMINSPNGSSDGRPRPRSITKQSTNKTVHYQQPSVSTDDELDDPHGFEDEWKLAEICGLITQKRDRLINLRGSQRMNCNKLISRVGTAHRFHYWDKYDDDDDAEWRVNPKYKDFKTEMLNNSLYSISPKQWDTLCAKAHDHYGTSRSRKIRPHKYWAELYDLQSANPTQSTYTVLQSAFSATFYKLNSNGNGRNGPSNPNSNANSNAKLEVEIEEESNEDLLARHSNFYHFGRLLRELIECFGRKIYNKNIVFYHGISDEMMFLETTMYFHAPLSTTTSIEVAIAYSNHNKNDYLLELADDDTVLGMARYFDCSWLSDYSNEAEKLFIGGYKPLKIHTVLDALLGRNYINYLKALHIIDQMMGGYHVETDSEEIKQITLHLLQCQLKLHDFEGDSKPHALNKEYLTEVQLLNKKSGLGLYMDVLSDDNEEDYDRNNLGTKPNLANFQSTMSCRSAASALSDGVHSFASTTPQELDPDDVDEAEMMDTRRRISHKVSRSLSRSQLRWNSTMASVDVEEYDYFGDTPKYVSKLVDSYCSNVHRVCVDWKNMTSRQFRFCRKLLCVIGENGKYEWLKLKAFLALFPNLKEMNVRNIRLSRRVIRDVHRFLERSINDDNGESKFTQFYRIEIFECDQSLYPITQCLDEFLDKFKELGWTLTFNPFEHEMCIVKLD